MRIEDSQPSPRERRSATVNLRLPQSLKKAAEEAAEKDSRTLTSLIQKLLKEHLRALECEGDQKGPVP